MKKIFLSLAGVLIVAALPIVAMASTLSASCAGSSTSTMITWTASSTGGTSPVTFLWSNGATSTTQTITENPGTYSMMLQVTDASSSVATTTCSTTIPQPTTTSTSPADQITAILNQIAALKVQLAQLLSEQASSTNTPSTTSTSTPCFSFNGDLHQGDHGGDVEDLQKVLAGDPALFSGNLITGYFGPLTADAVKKFQEKYGIPSTGYFGPMSRKYIEDQCAKGDSDHNGIPDSLDGVDNPEIDGKDVTSSSSQPLHSETESDKTQRQQEDGNRSSDN